MKYWNQLLRFIKQVKINRNKQQNKRKLVNAILAANDKRKMNLAAVVNVEYDEYFAIQDAMLHNQTSN